MKRRPRAEGDDGAALILVLAVIILCTLIITPMLTYAVTTIRASRQSTAKAERVEAVKGGLRTALSNPAALYQACDGVGETVGVNQGATLAAPNLTLGVKTTCYLMRTNFAEDETKRPYGVVSLQAGAVPAPYFYAEPGHLLRPEVYPLSGNTDVNYWWAHPDTSLVRLQYTIWTPNLPVHALNLRSPDPYVMPPEYGNCTVYFPGTYVDPITITGATPVFFTSGIYYFENTVTISGNANVVVGGGASDGCTTDQEAAFYAVNAPTTHNITGLGGTFVFGMAARLVVNNSVAGTPRLIFNQRYVSASDTNSLPSQTVNIMSVNGYLPGNDVANTLADFDLLNVLHVPLSIAPTTNGAFGPATLNKYRPSTLVPPDLVANPTAVDAVPIIDISFSANTAVTVEVPGYVSVPQGRFRLDIPTGSGFGANKTVNFSGGVMARTIEIPGDNPAAFSISVSEVVVQLVLRIKSETTTGSPHVESDAIVQVNKNGGYGVNSWIVQ